MTTTTTNGVEVIRWGHNLAKHKKVTGIDRKTSGIVSPHSYVSMTSIRSTSSD